MQIYYHSSVVWVRPKLEHVDEEMIVVFHDDASLLTFPSTVAF